MLKRYQNPNKDPSSNVFHKLLDSALSPALSGTEVAFNSKLFAQASNAGAGNDVQGLSFNEVNDDKDHDRRGK